MLHARTFNELSADPSRLESKIKNSDVWIIIDEIQKIPILLDEVHRLIKKQSCKFILQGLLDSPQEIDGFSLETLVFQECRAINEYKKLNFQFYSWSVSERTDVDLVLYGKNGLVAIEVKRTNRLRGGELDGLKAFKDTYPMARTFFLYQGEERTVEGISILPVDEFLKNKIKYLIS